MRTPLKDDEALPVEVRRELCRYEAGQSISYIKEFPGYNDLLQILKDDIEAARKKLNGYRDSDPNAVLRLLAELHGKEDALSNLERKVRQLTELASNPTPTIQKYIHF